MSAPNYAGDMEICRAGVEAGEVDLGAGTTGVALHTASWAGAPPKVDGAVGLDRGCVST